MNAMDREFLLQALIALVVTAGAWMMLVEPKAREIQTIEASLAAHQSDDARVVMPMAELAQASSTLRERVATLAEHNQMSPSSAGMYEEIGRLARHHDMVVQTIRPGALSEREAKGRDKSEMKTAVVDLSVVGTYENAAAFLESMTTIGGFVRPVSLVIAPESNQTEKRVTVRYVCEIVQFDVPEALAAFLEPSHG